MRVTVFGPGGVGGYLAARLAASPRVELSIIGRGEHLHAIQRDGLRLRSTAGDAHRHPPATDDPAGIGPVDLVLLTVKSQDVASAAPQLEPLLGDGTRVITLQNGIDAPRLVAGAIGEDRVLPGVAYIFSTVEAPGLIVHRTGPGRIVFGDPPGAETPRAHELGRFLVSAGVDAEVVDDPIAAMWAKFALICATAGVTATSRLPLDQLRQDASARRLLRELAEEVVAVGEAAGVDVPVDTAERALAFVDSVGPDAYSSLLYDLEHGKPMELEALHGTVVRLGQQHGVPVPATRTIHALLSPWARRNAAG